MDVALADSGFDGVGRGVIITKGETGVAVTKARERGVGVPKSRAWMVCLVTSVAAAKTLSGVGVVVIATN